ncbi:MAG: DUF1175 family protein [Thermoanaerobaculales bacterium]|jgi:uncharacterized protein YfaT (DUF1175 family)
MTRSLLLAFALLPAGLVEPATWGDTVRYRMLNEALAQAEHIGADWDPSQRDCAGFVRFLYRKSSGIRTPLWRHRDGSPAEFLAADELLAYNFTPISRAPQKDSVLTGDLLAFFDPAKPPADAWHVMVILQPPGTAPDRLLLVYHNGASGREAAVRKVWLDDLLTGPPEWRPVSTNPRFIGTFRWIGWSAAAKER